MSTTFRQHADAAHKGLHLVPSIEDERPSFLYTFPGAHLIYRLAAAGAALFLMMTVC